MYLTREYGMDAAQAAQLLFLFSSATNFTPILGAVLADSYVGRYRMIGFGCMASLLVTIFLSLAPFTILSSTQFFLGGFKNGAKRATYMPSQQTNRWFALLYDAVFVNMDFFCLPQKTKIEFLTFPPIFLRYIFSKTIGVSKFFQTSQFQGKKQKQENMVAIFFLCSEVRN